MLLVSKGLVTEIGNNCHSNATLLDYQQMKNYCK